jgi:hypothetical protein
MANLEEQIAHEIWVYLQEVYKIDVDIEDIIAIVHVELEG